MRPLRLTLTVTIALLLQACGAEKQSTATTNKEANPPSVTEKETPKTEEATKKAVEATPSVVTELPDIESMLSKGKEITEKTEFAYRFSKNTSSKYRIYVHWRLKGVDLPLGNFEGGFTSDLAWNVKDVASDGTAQVDITYESIRADFDAIVLGGKKFFDSKAPMDTPPDPLLAPFSKMVGKTFSLKISKQGNITDLTGQDKILDEALSDEKFPAELRAQIKSTLGEEGLAQLLGSGLLAFPEKALEKGEEFKTSSKLTVPGLGEINISEDVTLADIREIDGKKIGIFSMSIFALLDQKGSPSATKVGGLQLVGEATPTIGEGWFAFDLTDGVPSIATLPLPLLLNISFLKDDGSPTTEKPIEVVGEVAISAQLLEE